MLNIGFFIIAIIFIIIGSITDMRTREVPDWLNYAFIFTAFAANLIYSVILNNYSFVLNSLVGFVFGFLLALILFYTGQWGGGDSKMLIGIFTFIGLNAKHLYALLVGQINFFSYLFSAKWFLFLVDLGIAGAIYGIVYSIYLVIKHKEQFSHEFKSHLKPHHHEKMMHFVRNFALIMIIAAMITLMFGLQDADIASLLILGIIPLFVFYSWIFAKSLEKVAMHKRINAKKVTIGDWVIKDIFVKRTTKNFLKDAYLDYVLRTEKKLSVTKFTKLLTKDYLRKTEPAFKYFIITLNGKLLNAKTAIIRSILSSSSKSQFIKRAKKHDMSKQEIDQLFEFLNSYSFYFDKKFICGFNSTGLNESQVKLIHELNAKKKIHSVLVKEGIPFVPSFLFAIIIYTFLGFWWTFLLFI
jgi:Flp pilus assembly protein protease CpaA